MEAGGGADDSAFLRAEAVAVPACQFDGTFVRFGAGVGEEGLAEAAEFYQFFGGGGLLGGVVEVGAVDEASRLAGNGFHQWRIGMSEDVDGDAGKEVKVASAVAVIKIGTVAVIKDERVALEHGQIVLRVQGVDIVGLGHGVLLSFRAGCRCLPRCRVQG